MFWIRKNSEPRNRDGASGPGAAQKIRIRFPVFILPVLLLASFCSFSLDDVNGYENLSYLEDAHHSQNCQSIHKADGWKATGPVLNRGFSNGWIWVRLDSGQVPSTGRFLLFRQAMIGEAMFCSPNGVQRAGVDVPVPLWPVQIRYPTFRLPQAEGPFYFRIKSSKVINFPMHVISLPELLKHIQHRQVVQFSLLAAAWIAAIFFLAIFFYSPRQLYLLFSLMLTTVSTTLFIIYGDGYLYFWPASPEIQRAAFNLFSMLAAMASSLFARPLLKTWQWPWIDRIILTVVCFQALAAFSALIPALDPFFYFVLITGPFVGVVITVPIALLRLKEGDIPTRYYFLGWLVFLTAFFLNMLVFRGLVDYHSLMAHAPIGASPVAFLFFALGSYSRLQVEKRHRFRLQEKNRRLLEELEEAQRSMLNRKQRAEPSVEKNNATSDEANPGNSSGPGKSAIQNEETHSERTSRPDNMSGDGRAGPPEARTDYDANASSNDPGDGPVRSQLTGVDVEAKKALLLQAMKVDRLYEVEDLRLDALARHVDLRPHQLSELLNQILKTSFVDFLRKFRIDAAMARLSDPECKDSILDIGLAVGFGSKTAFNRSFSAITGMTPGQFRSQARRNDVA
ncbi:MAG: hypothetical protein CMF59_19925 [Leptospiraceae bacterium]|nr:hypothetical protein [Leptospiraceae bacterium]